MKGSHWRQSSIQVCFKLISKKRTAFFSPQQKAFLLLLSWTKYTMHSSSTSRK